MDITQRRTAAVRVIAFVFQSDRLILRLIVTE